MELVIMGAARFSKKLSLSLWILCKARKNIYKETDDGLEMFLLLAAFSFLAIPMRRKKNKVTILHWDYPSAKS